MQSRALSGPTSRATLAALSLVVFGVGGCYRAGFDASADASVPTSDAQRLDRGVDTALADTTSDQDPCMPSCENVPCGGSDGCGQRCTIGCDSEPMHDWSRGFGSTGTEYGHSVAIDWDGNVVVAGSFEGSVDFGGGQLVGDGGFVASFDQQGNHRWSKRFDAVGSALRTSVAVDSSGNVAVTGGFVGSIELGGGVIEGDPIFGGVFLASFDPSGQHRWSKGFVRPADAHGEAIAIDQAGSVIIAGYTFGDLDFGGGPLIPSGEADAFIASFDTNGAHIWSGAFGGASYDVARGVAVDDIGNIVIAGSFDAPADFGNGELQSTGTPDIFVASYTQRGSTRWSRAIGSASADYARAVAVDASGNVFVTGNFQGAVDFGGGQVQSVGAGDAFIASYDSQGNHRWARGLGGAGDDVGFGLAVDLASNVLITGWFRETVDFGDGDVLSQGNSDIFIANYASDGSYRWVKRFGAAGHDSGRGVATDGFGTVAVAGSFAGSIAFDDIANGGTPLVSAGGSDLFVVRFQQL